MRTLASIFLELWLLAHAALAQSWIATPACPGGACPLPSSPPSQSIAAPNVAANSLAVDSRAIVRIVNATGTARTLGSGALVEADDDEGLILTCAHLFRESVGTLSIVFPGREPLVGRLAKLDTGADLAALIVRAPRVEPISIAEDAPRRGDALVSCGYGSDGRLWCNRGQALGYVTAEGGQRLETLELSGAARFGDSGGPVLDRNHQLVAVLFGTNGHVVDATVCGRIHRFLADLVLRIRARRTNRLVMPKPPLQQPLQSPPLVDLTPIAPAKPNVEVPPSEPASPPDAAGDRAPRKPPAVELPGNLEPIGRAADSLANAAEPWISARLAAWLISIGVPGGVAGVAAGAAVWLVMRRGKKRLQSRLSRLQDRLGGAPTGGPAAAQTIEPQMIERHHNRYVAYEVTALDKAWAAAHAQVGERYPGAVPYLKIAESVKEQLLAGNSDSQPS
jgi:hypothetical protein